MSAPLTMAEIERYVDAAAAAHGLTLTGEQRARVLQHFARTAELVQPVLTLELSPDIEMAPVFRP